MVLNTVEDIRKALIELYPDLNDYEFSIEQSGFAHDHPFMATAVVLISSLVLRTTDPGALAKFTNYSEGFTSATAMNMQNSGLWKNNQYDCSSWFSGSLIPSTDVTDGVFWDHVEIAAGTGWYPHANIHYVQETDSIFWDDMRRQGKARGLIP